MQTNASSFNFCSIAEGIKTSQEAYWNIYSINLFFYLQLIFFWDIIPCNLLNIHNCFRGNCCPHLQGRRELEDGGIGFLQNIVTHLLNSSGIKTQKAVLRTSYLTLYHENFLFPVVRY
jgi:hypothetical protein